VLSPGALIAASDIAVPLPAGLRHLGESTTARIMGNPHGPLIVALGGISANRFVADSPGWWPGVVGSGCAIDPERHLILGMDFAADEQGLSAPSTRDQAEVLCAALDACGRGKADAVVGASYGGMTALALAEHWPERIDRLVVLSAPASPHPAATAGRELQRRAAALGIAAGRPEEGLSIARGLAMMTYRTFEEFGRRFGGGIADEDPLCPSDAGTYLRARGDAYGAVMSAGRFLSLSASIDRHCVAPDRIGIPALVIGAASDRLVPAEQVEALASALPDARLHILDSLYGHDMFLKDAAAVAPIIADFLEDA